MFVAKRGGTQAIIYVVLDKNIHALWVITSGQYSCIVMRVFMPYTGMLVMQSCNPTLR